MKFFLPLRLGLRSARQHSGLVLLVYLATLLPAAALGVLAWGELKLLDHSLFAAEALTGNRMGVWSDLMRGHPGDMGAVLGALRVLVPLLVVVQILVAAGVVEALLERERKREHPFLLGIGRHGWRFVRAAVWMAVVVVVLGLLIAGGFHLVNKAAGDAGDGRIQVFGWAGVLLLAVLLFVPFDLAYDLSRISAVTHDQGRTFVGFFKALGHTLRHPLILLPLWLFFTVFTVGWHLAYVAARASWGPGGLGEVIALLLVQQVVFLLAAFFRVALWGAEIAYYQAVGEPKWCGRKERTRRSEPAPPPAAPQDGDGDGDEDEGSSEGWGQLTGPAAP